MRLLLDQNLSFRLARRLFDVYPGSQHVRDVGLGAAEDEDIWSYAGRLGFILVSKDGDFHQRSFLLGPPPKFVWLRVGNCSTHQIELLLRRRAAQIAAFVNDQAAAVFILDRFE